MRVDSLVNKATRCSKDAELLNMFFSEKCIPQFTDLTSWPLTFDVMLVVAAGRRPGRN